MTEYRTFGFVSGQTPKGFVMNFNGEIMNNDGMGGIVDMSGLAGRFDRIKVGSMKPKFMRKSGYNGFIAWLEKYHPEVIDEASMSPELSGLGADAAASPAAATTPAAKTSWINSLTDAAAKILPLYQQQKVFSTQLKRAQTGLPPVDMSAYTADTGYQVGLNQSTQNTLLMVGGLLVGGLILWKVLSK